MNQGIGMTSPRTRLRLINQLRAEGINNEEVLAAMEKIPRHLFVDSAISHRAYENTALPIQAGQTISQPWTVARLTEILLDGLRQIGGERSKVLEIGSGCGYQAAILSLLFKQVYAIERISQLFEAARTNLADNKITNVHLSHRDGNQGWQEAAPFDAIVISAASDQVPQQLFTQLNPRACIILPFGPSDHQRLHLIKYQQGKIITEDHDYVVFVPLLGGVL